MANPTCPKCKKEGQFYANAYPMVLMECIPCRVTWKSKSPVCPNCKKPNGFAVEGTCSTCYSEGSGKK